MNNQKILPTPPLIRAARYFLDWTQSELGKRCELSKVSIIGIEAGRQEPNLETLKRIGKAFNDEGIVFNTESGFRVQTRSERGHEKIIKILHKKLENAGPANGEEPDQEEAAYHDGYINALEEAIRDIEA